MNTHPQHILLFHYFREFLVRANEARICAAPLKGAELVTTVYPAGEDRGTFADLDFLIKKQDEARVRSILLQMGFEESEGGKECSVVDHEMQLRLSLENGRSLLFEAHTGLFSFRRLPIDYNALWNRSTSSEFDGVPCRRLSKEDTFVHVAVHSGIHRWMEIDRSIRDLVFLALHGKIEWQKVVHVAQEWQVTRFVWLGMRFVKDAVPELNLEPWMHQLKPSSVAAKILSLIFPRGGGSRLSKLHHRGQAALIWPWLFDSPRILLRYVGGHSAVNHTIGRAERLLRTLK